MAKLISIAQADSSGVIINGVLCKKPLAWEIRGTAPEQELVLYNPFRGEDDWSGKLSEITLDGAPFPTAEADIKEALKNINFNSGAGGSSVPAPEAIDYKRFFIVNHTTNFDEPDGTTAKPFKNLHQLSDWLRSHKLVDAHDPRLIPNPRGSYGEQVVIYFDTAGDGKNADGTTGCAAGGYETITWSGNELGVDHLRLIGWNAQTVVFGYNVVFSNFSELVLDRMMLEGNITFKEVTGYADGCVFNQNNGGTIKFSSSTFLDARISSAYPYTIAYGALVQRILLRNSSLYCSYSRWHDNLKNVGTGDSDSLVEMIGNSFMWGAYMFSTNNANPLTFLITYSGLDFGINLQASTVNTDGLRIKHHGNHPSYTYLQLLTCVEQQMQSGISAETYRTLEYGSKTELWGSYGVPAKVFYVDTTSQTPEEQGTILNPYKSIANLITARGSLQNVTAILRNCQGADADATETIPYGKCRWWTFKGYDNYQSLCNMVVTGGNQTTSVNVRFENLSLIGVFVGAMNVASDGNGNNVVIERCRMSASAPCLVSVTGGCARIHIRESENIGVTMITGTIILPDGGLLSQGVTTQGSYFYIDDSVLSLGNTTTAPISLSYVAGSRLRVNNSRAEYSTTLLPITVNSSITDKRFVNFLYKGREDLTSELDAVRVIRMSSEPLSLTFASFVAAANYMNNRTVMGSCYVTISAWGADCPSTAVFRDILDAVEFTLPTSNANMPSTFAFVGCRKMRITHNGNYQLPFMNLQYSQLKIMTLSYTQTALNIHVGAYSTLAFNSNNWTNLSGYYGSTASIGDLCLSNEGGISNFAGAITGFGRIYYTDSSIVATQPETYLRTSSQPFTAVSLT